MSEHTPGTWVSQENRVGSRPCDIYSTVTSSFDGVKFVDDPICSFVTAGDARLIMYSPGLAKSLQEAVECVEGLMADFDGCTDNANDPWRTHDFDDSRMVERFDWLEDAKATLAALAAAEGEK